MAFERYGKKAASIYANNVHEYVNEDLPCRFY